MIENCVLTNSNTTIRTPWYVVDNYYTRRIHIHTGVDVVAESVYSICDGIVIYSGTELDGKHYTCVIQYDASLVFQYSNLSDNQLDSGMYVYKGQLLGTADHFVHVEALVATAPDLVFPVTFNSITYYKIDPTPYIDGRIDLVSPTSYNQYKYQLK